MAMKQINAAEAAGPALDWLVAKCEWVQWTFETATTSEIVEDCHYSTSWAQGGPIIEREAHNLFKHNGGTEWCCACNVPRDGYTAIVTADGPTPLIAAMRCYVASKLGDTGEVPEELL